MDEIKNENVNFDLFGNSINNKSNISRDEITKILRNNLKDLSLKDLSLLFTNKFTEIINYYDLCNGGKTCQKMSLLFNPHRLNVRSITSKMSVYEAFKDENWFNGLARVVILNKNKVSEVLYQSIAMNINGVQYINEFPPHVARNIYSKYVDKNSKILDPCAGWGGRLIGASVVSDNYTCFEPSTVTYNGLLELFDFIKNMNNDFNANIFNCCYEDMQLPNDFYDIALTSPPYYDTEHYSKEDTNSMNRYKTFNQWCDMFYLPMIQKTMDSLKENCYFILNIGSRKYPLNEVLINNFKDKYFIDKEKEHLSNSTGLNKSGEGETFYRIKK